MIVPGCGSLAGVVERVFAVGRFVSIGRSELRDRLSAEPNATVEGTRNGLEVRRPGLQAVRGTLSVRLTIDEADERGEGMDLHFPHAASPVFFDGLDAEFEAD